MKRIRKFILTVEELRIKMEDLTRTVQGMEAYLKTFSETILIRMERVEGKLETLCQAKSESRLETMELQEPENPQHQQEQQQVNKNLNIY